MTISIFWFRQDLRLSDNPGLIEATKRGAVLPIYILDKLSPLEFSPGSASKVYLHHALIELNQSLDSNLNLYTGNPQEIILDIIKRYDIKNIFWNKCYEPWYISHDIDICKMLVDLNINYSIFNASYLWNPESITKDDGSYYKVFSAYKRKVCLHPPRKPLPSPEGLISVKDHKNTLTLDSLNLLPKHQWVNKILSYWTFGERSAQEKLIEFVDRLLPGYKESRNFPSKNQTSMLSASLHFGEISPHQVWDYVNKHFVSNIYAKDIEHFLSEIIWREFSCYLMTHFNELHFSNFQAKFNNFPWKYDKVKFHAWKTGNTGYPIIDAGMRELWQTGYMHNRVRMIVASFLVKNLMIHWHYGRDWFWDCLVDSDLANNSASWQWVAGSGVDAAPYFRIFNPITQGEKFDQDGTYTKRFVPELSLLPNKYLFKPWEASKEILRRANVTLGVNYPKPIIDFKTSRNNALFAYTVTK